MLNLLRRLFRRSAVEPARLSLSAIPEPWRSQIAWARGEPAGGGQHSAG